MAIRCGNGTRHYHGTTSEVRECFAGTRFGGYDMGRAASIRVTPAQVPAQAPSLGPVQGPEVDRFADSTLQNEIRNRTGGYARAAGYLLQVPYGDRAQVEGEGTCMAGMTPGWRYADAVGHVVRSWLKGNKATPYLDMNRAIIERERRERGW